MTVFLSCVIASMGISAGTVFCLATAFDIPVSVKMLLLLCAFFSVLWSLVFRFDNFLWAFLGALTVLLLLFWHKRGEMLGGLSIVLEQISTVYSGAFGWPLQPIVIGHAPNSDATVFMAAIACWTALAAAETVANSQRLWQPALLCAVFISLCLAVIETAPAPWPVWLLAGSFLLLLLSQRARRCSHAAGARQFMLLILPVTAFVLLLSFAAPVNSIERPRWSEGIRFGLTRRIEQLSRTESPMPETETETPAVDVGVMQREELRALGPRKRNSAPVMTVTAEHSGVYYLKGISFGRYEDNCWSVLLSEEYTGRGVEGGLWGAESIAGGISIVTQSKEPLFYLPPVPAQLPPGTAVNDSHVINRSGLREYSVSYGDTWAEGSLAVNSAYESFVFEKYTAVPDGTRAAFADIVSGFDISIDAQLLANAAADFVRQSAEYDLNAPVMEGDSDFAAWFLTEGEKGYCVHFAASSAVLLRCLGIPSRYVSGYMVKAEENVPALVTENDAHAWTEYYLSGKGWQVLECTPGAERGSAIPESDTEPEETPAPTAAPTQPEEAEAPEAAEKPGKKVSAAGRAFLAAGIIIFSLFGFELRVRALRYKRRKSLSQGDVNSRAVAAYRHLLLLSGLGGGSVEEACRELAEKARFSRHQLTQQELDALLSACEKSEAELLSGANILTRLKLRFLHGI